MAARPAPDLRRFVDLGLTVALGVCALLASLAAPPGSLVRIALTAPLVLFLPGYALSAALVPARLGLAARFALGLGLSLALGVCGGLVLNLTPWGLTSTSWPMLLLLVTVVGSLAAASQRVTSPLGTAGPFAGRSVHIRLLDIGLLASAAVIGGVAIWFSSTPPPEQPNQEYALLWAVPDPQVASTIHLGVQNMQPVSTDYVLRVERADQTVQEYSLQLEPTQTWQTDLQLQQPLDESEAAGDLHALLFRADAPYTPFRQTVIRVAS
jgi:hypothetical protein